MNRSAHAVLPGAAAVLFFVCVLADASAAQQGARDGLALSLQLAVPALFPFFLTSGLLTGTGVTDALGRLCARPLARLYGLPGCAAGPLLLGLTGGYPVGAASAAELYRTGALTRAQAERLLGFCNNTGPAFIVGVCGAGLLGSVRAGLGLYAVHALAALITGLAMTAAPAENAAVTPARRAAAPREPFSSLLVRVTRDSFSSCLSISAFITAFSVLRAVLDTTGVLALARTLLTPACAALGLPAETAHPLLTGALELTSGLALLPELHLPARQALPVMSALLAFGSLSVWCQSMSVCAGSGLRLRRCFIGKCLHAAVAAALAAIWCALSPRTVPAFAGGGGLPVLPLWAVLAPAFIILLTFTYGKLRQNKL